MTSAVTPLPCSSVSFARFDDLVRQPSRLCGAETGNERNLSVHVRSPEEVDAKLGRSGQRMSA
jgi:hypothetical protein